MNKSVSKAGLVLSKRISKAGLILAITGLMLILRDGNLILLGWGLAIVGTFCWVGFDME